MADKNQKKQAKAAKHKAAEEAKLQNTREVIERLEAQGYTGREKTISILAANIYALLLWLPFVVAGVWAFMALHGRPQNPVQPMQNMVIFMAAYLASIFVHEGLHGGVWSLFCTGGMKSIRFGIMHGFTPYCHCMEALGFWQYMAGAAAPLVVLGLAATAAGIIAGSSFWLFFGLLGILGAGGDMTIMIILAGSRADMYIDHPSKCGFIAFYREGNSRA